MQSTIDRRGFLLGGVAVTALIAGCLSVEEANGNGDDDDPVEADEEVLVGPDGENEFDPADLQLQVGQSVQFTWESSGHTVTIDIQPEESNWEGHPEEGDEGDTHEHTFTAEGAYTYYCANHEDEMVGNIFVEDPDIAPGDDDDPIG